MKKELLILIAFLTYTSVLTAQKIGVTAGLNFADITSSDGEDEDVFNTRISFRAGVFSEFQISNSISIEPSLLLNSKGVNIDYEDGDNFSPLYIELPILAKYSVALDGVDLFFKGGPYLAYGIGGTLTEGGETTDIEWGDGDFDINPFDAGISIGAGIEFGNLIVGLGYDFGLIDLARSEVEAHHRIFHLSAGYVLFGN